MGQPASNAAAWAPYASVEEFIPFFMVFLFEKMLKF
jgi:hypothetical protein